MNRARAVLLPILLIAAVLSLGKVPAYAQPATEPDPSQVRMRFGPLWVDPTIALTNIGIDTNVFNDARTEDPQSDFTMTLSPEANLWLRMGRSWLTGTVKEDLVWYKRYSSERSVNNSYSVALVVPLTRLTLTSSSDWILARERPGFEIDARSNRSERGVDTAAEVRLLAKTHVGARAERRWVEFDKDAVFLGANLHDELTRTQTTAAVTVRHALTPLTSLTFDAGRQMDRFTFTHLRDADSTYANLGVRFDARALISGTAKFGIRDFSPQSSDMPAFRGGTTSLDLSYVALGATRMTLQASRDVQYSFDVNRPYYLQTGFTASVAQHIYGPFDLEGHGGAQRLAYRSRTGVGVGLLNPVDRVRTYGGGVGYRMGRDVRVGFSIEKQSRSSELERRDYDGLRVGAAVTYAR